MTQQLKVQTVFGGLNPQMVELDMKRRILVNKSGSFHVIARARDEKDGAQFSEVALACDEALVLVAKHAPHGPAEYEIGPLSTLREWYPRYPVWEVRPDGTYHLLTRLSA